MKEIRGHKWYRPREIANLGLITNGQQPGSRDSNYVFIIGLIKELKLEAKNYGRVEGRPYWLVSETEIERYNASLSQFNETSPQKDAS